MGWVLRTRPATEAGGVNPALQPCPAQEAHGDRQLRTSSPSRCASLSSRSGAVQNQHKWWLTCPEPDGDGGDVCREKLTWAAHSVMRACPDRILDSQRPCRTSWASSCLGRRTACDLSRRLSRMAHHRATRQDTNTWGRCPIYAHDDTPGHTASPFGCSGGQGVAGSNPVSPTHETGSDLRKRWVRAGSSREPEGALHTYSASIRERARPTRRGDGDDHQQRPRRLTRLIGAS